MHRNKEIRNNSNPRDCSRGVKFNDLSNNYRWITGRFFLCQQTTEVEQALVTGFTSYKIIDSSINVNLHRPLKGTGLSKRQLSNTQIVIYLLIGNITLLGTNSQLM